MTRDFLHLFRGNPAAVGLDDAGRGKPGPLRLDSPDERDQKWMGLADGHLAGHLGIGVYPVCHLFGGSVAWGCVDIDLGDVESWSHAVNLQELLADLDVPVWIERSRSKGYHVWLFCGDWVAARWMRQLFLGACAVVEAPAKEVNPKSDKLSPTQLGNFVRLPYLGAAKGPIQRQVVVGPGGQPIPLAEFVKGALDASVTADRVVRVAKTLYHPPRPHRQHKGTVKPGPWQDRLNGLAERQLRDGPRALPKPDRSSYLMAFGYACAESGLTHREIEKAVRVADLIHCHKYEGRKDAPDRYGDIATKAINKEEPW